MLQGLQDEGGGGGSLGDEGEAAVGVDGDDHGDLEAGLILGALVEFFNESRDVHAMLAKGGADRGGSGCLGGGNLQFDNNR